MTVALLFVAAAIGGAIGATAEASPTPNRLEGGWFMRTPGARGTTVYEFWRHEYAVSIDGYEVSRGSYEFDESRVTM